MENILVEIEPDEIPQSVSDRIYPKFNIAHGFTTRPDGQLFNMFTLTFVPISRHGSIYLIPLAQSRNAFEPKDIFAELRKFAFLVNKYAERIQMEYIVNESLMAVHNPGMAPIYKIGRAVCLGADGQKSLVCTQID